MVPAQEKDSVQEKQKVRAEVKETQEAKQEVKEQD